MAARWIGLMQPSLRPRRRRDGWLPRLAAALRATCWAGALAGALAFNLIAVRDMLAPDARASVEIGPTQAVIPDPADVHLLAATMWGEARSEGEDGMRAVAHVMVNRVGARFGEDLRSVILAPKQFSAWNLNDPNRPLVMNPERYAKSGEDRDSWIIAQRVAYEVLSGASLDPTSGSLFYHTTAINPSWSRHGVGSRVIGAHIFYRDVPDNAARVRRISSEGALAAMQAAPRAAATPAPLQSLGRRAGRVHGVIQVAPADADAPPPTIVLDPSQPVTPPELAEAISDL